MSSSGHARQRRLRRCSASAVLVAVLVSGAHVGAATTLGGLTTSTLTALTLATTTTAPVVVAWEGFGGASGSAIAGTTTDGGSKVWSVNPTGGVWQTAANQAQSTTANSSLVIDPAQVTYSAFTTIARNGSISFDSGLTVNRNTAGTQFLTCEWTSASNGSMELWKFNGSWTLLASVTNLVPSGIGSAPATVALGCTSGATLLSASINATTVVSATLSAADQTTFKNATHRLAGPYQYTVSALTFDDVHVDVP